MAGGHLFHIVKACHILNTFFLKNLLAALSGKMCFVLMNLGIELYLNLFFCAIRVFQISELR